jgi:hypothetical protein
LDNLPDGVKIKEILGCENEDIMFQQNFMPEEFRMADLY